jgi:UDP-2-acetamido-3-amino-2,3-dideoxy-glucuronate N-acetyltransferase
VTGDFFAHPTAVIDSPCEIGRGSKIWHFCHIMAGAKLGERCILGQNVFVATHVQLGNNVKVQNNVSIYEGVVLEDDVFCGPSMVFTNIRNPRSQVIRKGQYLQTLVRRGATLGANSTIVCGVTIGQFAFVGAGAVITKDVPDFALVMGVPGRIVGWMSAYGERLPDFDAEGYATCPATSDRYRLVDGVVRRLTRDSEAILVNGTNT